MNKISLVCANNNIKKKNNIYMIFLMNIKHDINMILKYRY